MHIFEELCSSYTLLSFACYCITFTPYICPSYYYITWSYVIHTTPISHSPSILHTQPTSSSHINNTTTSLLHCTTRAILFQNTSLTFIPGPFSTFFLNAFFNGNWIQLATVTKLMRYLHSIVYPIIHSYSKLRCHVVSHVIYHHVVLHAHQYPITPSIVHTQSTYSSHTDNTSHTHTWLNLTYYTTPTEIPSSKIQNTKLKNTFLTFAAGDFAHFWLLGPTAPHAPPFFKILGPGAKPFAAAQGPVVVVGAAAAAASSQSIRCIALQYCNMWLLPPPQHI